MHKHYKLIGITLALLVALQLPFLHVIPNEETAESIVNQYNDVVGDNPASIDAIYNDMLVWWALPIANVLLFAISSFLSFKRNNAFIVPFGVSLIAYVLLYDYKMILEAPGSLYDIIMLPTYNLTAFKISYDIITNYIILPIAYIGIPLLYISSNKASKPTAKSASA